MDWGTIVAIGVPFVSAVFGVDFYIHRNAQSEREEAIKAKDNEIALLHGRINECTKELWEYKVNSAQHFATVTGLLSIRTEIEKIDDRFSERFDRVNERFDKLFEEIRRQV